VLAGPDRRHLPFKLVGKTLPAQKFRGSDDAISGAVAALEQKSSGRRVANRKDVKVVFAAQQDHGFEAGEVTVIDGARDMDAATPDRHDRRGSGHDGAFA